ncbi:uncharacterized protein BP01DRAFT_423852 [Aspergillus saccharolyticus JOP 1030-1]|uniref:F-box domain-containing protein n=1 Tax=Aspergillus saccharolyticus JOP 1030-1 TaxID=1450539 RepID=A0A318ZC19_9EURO|nr:hypothetical protein BP01DRAFT_423852 [Aspergillus saccharolyticus JOP 1030-1]PYH44956.1 hypothetical protein BP01DRAFT_423852 [Aspergillus saccharolyticus JOP 1030-1]
MSNNLAFLPPELFYMMAESLNAGDLLSLRAVSTRLKLLTAKALKPVWAHSLQVIHTNFSNESLSLIHQIAKSDELKEHVKIMKIVPPFGPLMPLHRVTMYGLIKNSTGIPKIKTLKDDLVHSLRNCRSFEVCLSWKEGTLTYLDSDDILNILFHIFIEAELPVEHLALYTHRYTEESHRSKRARPYTRMHKQPDLARAWTGLTTLQVTQPYFFHLANHLYRILPQIIETAPRLETLILIGDAISGQSNDLVSVIKNVKPLAEIRHIEIYRSSLSLEDLKDWLLVVGGHLQSLTFSGCFKVTAVSWAEFFRCVKKHCPLLVAVTFEGVEFSADCLTEKHVGQGGLADVLYDTIRKFEKENNKNDRIIALALFARTVVLRALGENVLPCIYYKHDLVFTLQHGASDHGLQMSQAG